MSQFARRVKYGAHRIVTDIVAQWRGSAGWGRMAGSNCRRFEIVLTAFRVMIECVAEMPHCREAAVGGRRSHNRSAHFRQGINPSSVLIMSKSDSGLFG
ncbi:hypothetical protein [Paraburkholderia caballeronis]|uniref:hypothetical protein n=1 Tax=Paraburkholderia caballeronis TaxID=416943 RepID=UPI001066301A|nr:hypothetical protein [Paraburkholderia caballeronis]